tara:strand:+ start:1105 stop:1293 length:189 start_codon:yes stop_codon:yes gene_type:complete
MDIKKTITNAKYRKAVDTDTISCVVCEIDGQKSYVPLDEANTDYAEIKRQVDAGELTIEDAD